MSADNGPRIPTTARSLAIDKYCTPDEYKILQLPVPQITAPDELLIKVSAASINPSDVKLASGEAKSFFPRPLPHALGSDLSGTIISISPELGSSHPDLKPGTEVYACLPEHCHGSVSEYARATASTTAVKPQAISHVEAASIPVASLTTLQAFDLAEAYFEGGLKGKTVFIPGGLSGTGSIAVQLAKRVFGARWVITTLSKAKIPVVAGLLGHDVVDQIIDYTEQDPRKVIPPGSVDFMYDTMDQSGSSLPLMKKGGIIVSISGMPYGPGLKATVPAMPAIVRWLLNAIGALVQFRARLYGVTQLCHFMSPRAIDLERLGAWIDQGSIKPVVGRVAKLEDLEEVREGCRQVYAGKGGVGKFVIEIENPDT